MRNHKSSVAAKTTADRPDAVIDRREFITSAAFVGGCAALG
jgi:hypothetical protein